MAQSDSDIQNMFENRDMLTGVPYPSRHVPPMKDLFVEERQVKRTRIRMLSTVLCYCMGFQALWRFPIVAYHYVNGGFVYIYILMVLLTAHSMNFLEICLGQYSSKGPEKVFDFCPLFEGLGWSMILHSFLLSYCIVSNMGYSLFYLSGSFKSELPWLECSQDFEHLNHTLKIINIRRSALDFNQTACKKHFHEHTNSSAVYYWQITIREDHGYKYRTEIAICLVICWLIIFHSTSKSFKSAFRMILITQPIAIIALIIFLIVCLAEDGFYNGFKLFFTLDWQKFLSCEMWAEATVQALLSLGTSSGILITLGSNYNFRAQYLFKDLKLITGISVVSNILMGLLFFLNTGKMFSRYKIPLQNMTHIDLSVIYIVYSDMVTGWHHSKTYNFIFFLVLATVAANSCLITLEVLKVAMAKRFPYIYEHKVFWSFVLYIICCLCMMLDFNLAGDEILNNILLKVCGSSILIIGFLELVVVFLIYGGKRFSNDVKFMLNASPNYSCYITWWLNLLILLAATVIIFLEKNPYLTVYKRRSIGFSFLGITLAPIILIAIKNILTYARSRELKNVIKPRPSAGPAGEIWKAMRESFTSF